MRLSACEQPQRHLEQTMESWARQLSVIEKRARNEFVRERLLRCSLGAHTVKFAGGRRGGESDYTDDVAAGHATHTVQAVCSSRSSRASHSNRNSASCCCCVCPSGQCTLHVVVVVVLAQLPVQMHCKLPDCWPHTQVLHCARHALAAYSSRGNLKRELASRAGHSRTHNKLSPIVGRQ